MWAGRNWLQFVCDTAYTCGSALFLQGVEYLQDASADLAKENAVFFPQRRQDICHCIGQILTVNLDTLH